MKKIIMLTIIIPALLVMTSCTTSPVCITSSVTPLEGKVIAENLGRVEGADTAYTFFGFMKGRPDADLAVKRALQSKGADTLINVSVYETTYGIFLIFSATTVTVEGIAIRFQAAETEKKGKKK